MRKLKNEKRILPRKEKPAKSQVKFKGSVGGFFRDRIVIGSICVVFALLVAFVGLPIAQSYVSQRVHIIVAACDMDEGTLVTAEMLKLSDVGAIDRPPEAAQDVAQVIGTYVATPLMAGDYIISKKLTKTPPLLHPYLYDLAEGKQAVSISIKGLAEGLSGKLQAGDIVSVYASSNQGASDEGYAAVQIPELRYVRVLATSNSLGNDIEIEPDDFSLRGKDDERDNLPATITLQAGPEQAALLVGMDHNSTLHVALLARANNPALCDSLLAKQDVLIRELLELAALAATNGTLQAEESEGLPATPSVIQEENEESVGESNG